MNLYKKTTNILNLNKVGKNQKIKLQSIYRYILYWFKVSITSTLIIIYLLFIAFANNGSNQQNYPPNKQYDNHKKNQQKTQHEILHPFFLNNIIFNI